LVTREGAYKGSFKDGIKEGQAIFEFTHGLTYEGSYLNGERSGKGRIINSNRSICFEGDLEHGLPHGWGRCCDEQGNMKEGEFKCGIAAIYYDRMLAEMV
jgi:hypothetical protein